MTPAEFAVCFVPVPLRQRHLVAGDVFVIEHDDEVNLWTVRDTRPGWMNAAHGPNGYAGDVDPDQVFQVLTPVPMAQAMAITRTELGARVIERRNSNTTKGAA
jgi:hypothetical protein